MCNTTTDRAAAVKCKERHKADTLQNSIVFSLGLFLETIIFRPAADIPLNGDAC